jgi:hypothetical protein
LTGIYTLFFSKKSGEVTPKGWKNLAFYAKKHINSEVKGGKC